MLFDEFLPLLRAAICAIGLYLAITGLSSRNKLYLYLQVGLGMLLALSLMRPWLDAYHAVWIRTGALYQEEVDKIYVLFNWSELLALSFIVFGAVCGQARPSAHHVDVAAAQIDSSPATSSIDLRNTGVRKALSILAAIVLGSMSFALVVLAYLSYHPYIRSPISGGGAYIHGHRINPVIAHPIRMFFEFHSMVWMIVLFFMVVYRLLSGLVWRVGLICIYVLTVSGVLIALDSPRFKDYDYDATVASYCGYYFTIALVAYSVVASMVRLYFQWRRERNHSNGLMTT